MRSAIVVTWLWLCVAVILSGIGWSLSRQEARPTYHDWETFTLCVDPDQAYSFESNECVDRPALPVKHEDPIVWIGFVERGTHDVHEVRRAGDRRV